jgi:hypothetical protein
MIDEPQATRKTDVLWPPVELFTSAMFYRTCRLALMFREVMAVRCSYSLPTHIEVPVPSLAITERQSTKTCVDGRLSSVPHEPDQNDGVLVQCDGVCSKQMRRR